MRPAESRTDGRLAPDALQVELGDPFFARLAALTPLAEAASASPQVPDELAETGSRIAFLIGREEFDEARHHVAELREYC